MRLGFNLKEDPQGILESVGSTLCSVRGVDDKRTLFLIGVTSPLNNVGAFTEAHVEMIRNMDALAVFFYEEAFDVSHFAELSPVQKFFVRGVEDQLARKVVYVGCFATPTKIQWVDVPSDDKDRWRGQNKEDVMDAVINGVLDDISAERGAHE